MVGQRPLYAGKRPSGLTRDVKERAAARSNDTTAAQVKPSHQARNAAGCGSGGGPDGHAARIRLGPATLASPRKCSDHKNPTHTAAEDHVPPVRLTRFSHQLRLAPLST